MNKVFSISEENILPYSVRMNCRAASSCNEIEIEIMRKISESKLRNKLFNDILNNYQNDHENKETLKYILFGFGTIGAAFLSTCFQTFIPQHNVIENPVYWYELLLVGVPTLVGLLSAYFIYTCSHWMNVSFIKSFRKFFIMWLVGGLVGAIVIGAGYILWTYSLNYRYPIPFICYIELMILSVMLFMTLWFLFPSKWRKNKEFHNRLKWLILALTINQFMAVEYAIITKVFISIRPNYQWILALILPIIREINIWIITSLAKKSARGDLQSVAITCNHGVCTGHSLFLAYIVGNVATNVSAGLILATDFMINIYITLRIITIQKKNPMTSEKGIELLQELVVSEMVEFMIPIFYLIVFIAAYYGPNANLIGNIGNSYWQYNAVEDVGKTVGFVSIFFFIDFCSVIFCSYLLWKFCQINLLRPYVALQREFGMVFLLNLCYKLNGVRQYDIKHIINILIEIKYLVSNTIFYYYRISLGA